MSQGAGGALQIRVVSTDEAQALAALRERMPTSSTDGAGATPDAAREQRIELLAWIAGEAVGLAQVSLVVDAGVSAALRTLFVLPEHRRRGVARALLREVECHLGERGVTSLEFELATGAEGPRSLDGAALSGMGFELVTTVRRYRRHVGADADAPSRPGLAVGAAADAAAPLPPLVIHAPARRGWLIANGLLAAVALVCLLNTDVFSADPVRGGLLPLLDVGFFIYFAVVFVGWRYRRQTLSQERASELFQYDPPREG
jgi:GNAT superfamily N-acetyltransferase